MMVFIRITASELFRDAMVALGVEGAAHERGGQRMLEIDGPVALVLTDPTQYLVLQRARQLNPWVSLAEFPWLITGRNDIAWLQHYLPRAADFSDDGETWRAGYGPRLRRWGGRPGTAAGDQLTYVLGELRPPATSRRAVMTLWDPGADTTVSGSRDYPCTNWLSFQVRASGRLDLLVGMRSNDAWWGWSGVNMVNFSLLLQAVAQWSGLRIGFYTHVADNFHLYAARHAGAASDATMEVVPARCGEPGDFCDGLREFERAAAVRMKAITHERANAEGDGEAIFETPESVAQSGDPKWIDDWAFFMGLHALRRDPEALFVALRGGFGDRRRDWQHAAIAWAGRP
jgi:thymidylate synthase